MAGNEKPQKRQQTMRIAMGKAVLAERTGTGGSIRLDSGMGRVW
jgi:hypothetical protein